MLKRLRLGPFLIIEYWRDFNMADRFFVGGLPVKLTKNSDGSNSISVSMEGGSSENLNDASNKSKYIPAGNIKNIEFIDTAILDANHQPIPKWRDNSGTLWGTGKVSVSRNIYKSEDDWRSVELAIQIPNGFGGLSTGALMVGATGRIVVCTTDGYVFVSDEGRTNFPAEPAFKFRNRYCQYHLAHDTVGDYMIMGEYGDKADDGVKQIYLSTDAGATWKLVFDPEPGTYGDITQLHIHDVAIDPYTMRIWGATGDTTANSNMFYSDDFGDTWNYVFDPKTGLANSKVTQIVCFDHGTVFGSDAAPDGFRYIKKQQGVFEPIYSAGDYQFDYYNLDTKNKFDHFAVRRWVVETPEYNLTLVPWRRDKSTSGGAPRITATLDGISWYQLFKGGPKDIGFHNVIGPKEGGNTIISIYSKEGVLGVLRAELPNIIER